jgi:hypothetical protein
MAIRIRSVEGVMVALCAARSVGKVGDVYLDDAQHHALYEKFAEDFESEGYDTRPLCDEETRVRAREEANNPARAWWDATYCRET